MIEALLLALSFPLRLMATYLATWLLMLFGANVSADYTTIRIGEAGIAITDSCSGIEQLGAMLILGLVISKVQQGKWLPAAFQYGFIIPSIVISNALRIALTAALYLGPLGEAALGDGWHVALGWVQTVLAFVFLFLFGLLVKVSTVRK